MNAFDGIFNIFKSASYIQEDFKKNYVSCVIATSDDKCTLGFTEGIKQYPKSLLKGNELDSVKSGRLSLVLRKKRNEAKFNTIILGDEKLVEKELARDNKLKDIIDIKQYNKTKKY